VRTVCCRLLEFLRALSLPNTQRVFTSKQADVALFTQLFYMMLEVGSLLKVCTINAALGMPVALIHLSARCWSLSAPTHQTDVQAHDIC
jgi:hypothetical protein